MQKTARDIAQLVGGELSGDNVPIHGVAGIREAEPGDLTFLGSSRYAMFVSRTAASAIIVGLDYTGKTDRALIRVKDPVAAFAQVAALFAPLPIQFPPCTHATAVIAPTARIGKHVSIQPHAVIEDGATIGDRTVIGAGCYIGQETRIGTECLLYPCVVVRERCRIGNRVIIHSGAVIGADGFGYEPTPQGPKKIPQTGIVQIDDEVEIGANVTIDRARFGKTRIGRNVKIDNLVQIAHNVIIGENTVICGMAGIAGSAIVGKNVTLAAQVGLGGHIEIGDNAMIGGKSGVSRDVPAGESWFGFPAQPQRDAMRAYAALIRLPQLQERVRALEEIISKKKPARNKSK